MYDFITFNVKCPNCTTSLMDPSKHVDNNPGIKLHIEIAGNNGTIWLSSIYGSYNYICDIESPVNEIATFTCPHCNDQIKSDETCKSCSAPMIPFNLKMGGAVSICSRSGCKDHFVEFDDLETAMKKLYEEHGIRGKHLHVTPQFSDKMQEEPKKDEKQEIIESGSFLQTYCMHCKKSLIENGKLKLKINNGKEGLLFLSPYLNVFTSLSTIYLPENKTVTDIKCFHCNQSIIVKDKKCEECGSPIAKVLVSARTKMIDFYICSKKGCRWHGLNEDDYNDIRLEDSLEW